MTIRLNSSVHIRDILKYLWTTSDCSRQKLYNSGKRINEILWTLWNDWWKQMFKQASFKFLSGIVLTMSKWVRCDVSSCRKNFLSSVMSIGNFLFACFQDDVFSGKVSINQCLSTFYQLEIGISRERIIFQHWPFSWNIIELGFYVAQIK